MFNTSKERKVSKKIFAILAVVFLLASVIGCAPAQPATEVVEPTAAAAEPTEAAAEPTEAPAEPTAAPAETEVVMLDYYIVGAGDTDKRPQVEEAINAYIEPLIGANVTFHIIPWNDWATKAVTGMQAGEKMDIFFTADWYFYMQLASEGLFTPLNDPNGPNGNLLEEYGDGIVKSMNPAYLTGTQIDGVNYAVPTNKELSVPWGFVYNATLADEIGFTDEEAAKVTSFKDLEPWVAKAKEARPDEYPYLTDGKAVGFMQWVHGFASNVDDFLVNMSDRPDASGTWDESIVRPIESDFIKDYLTTMRDWNQKGYINPDAALATFVTGDFLNAGKFFIEPMPLKGDNIKAQELVIASGNPDLKLKEIYGEPKTVQTNDTGGSMLAIPTVSDHPVEAMKLINLMHTDSTLINMMLYGVPETMWTVDPDGRVNVVDSAWVGAHPGAWVWGDVLIQKVTNKEDPNKNQMLIDYSKDALPHPSLGFRFRTEPVTAELTAMKAVVDGMQQALFTGNVDPEVEYEPYIQSLKDAGYDKVYDEVVKQYTDWKAKKGE
jgi:putative aldouronate transport system substrate-binding protein